MKQDFGFIEEQRKKCVEIYACNAKKRISRRRIYFLTIAESDTLIAALAGER
jgi:hypothetical protein